MLFSRILLVLLGLMFLSFGVAFLLRPAQMAQMVGIELPEPTARMEIRAFYGGLEIGLAVFLFACAATGVWIMPGLAAEVACAVAVALALVLEWRQSAHG